MTRALLVVATLVGFAVGNHGATCDTAGVESAMRRHGVSPEEFPNPLAVSEAMRATAQAVMGEGAGVERVRRLQQYLFDEVHFTINGDPRATYTAMEAFDARQGNCVSFTTMLVALACSGGVSLRPALKATGETEREGDLILISDHVVAVHRGSPDATVFDFNLRRDKQWVGLRLISDLALVAIHLNNLGIAAVLDDDNVGALRYFEAATRLRAEFAEAYGNLGVVRRRAGDEAGALDAYRQALELDPDSPTTLHNLAAIYDSMGRPAEALAALQAADVGELNPYTLIVFGDFELVDGRPRRALRLYRRAARKGRFIPEPQIAIARAEIARERPRAARSALRKALALDPDHELAAQLLEHVDAASRPRLP